jgi:ATP-dependent DNA helicase RecQ
MYPFGVLAEGRKKIDESKHFLPGATISVYNDAGWGQLVRDGKYAGTHFSDELIEPSVRAIRSLDVQPEWLCWIPSLSRSELVPDFARRLAAALGIGVVEAVRKVQQNQPQKMMQNSSKQFDNVWESFDVVASKPGVCLLVDDVVDSGWTMTIVATKLVRAGATGVIPFALATAKPRD